MSLFEKVHLQTSSIQGRGIFAKRKIKKNEVLFNAIGPFIHFPLLPNHRKGPHWLNVAEKTWMMPIEKTPWRYINHSCAPNAGLKGSTTVVAMQEIKKGEEILIDYSITESHPEWSMNCLCKTKHCRATIRGIQSLPWERYEAYKPYIPAFLKKLYLKDKIYPTYKKASGVFAKQKIKKGELLFKVEGPTVKYSFPPDYRLGPHWISVGKQKWLIPLENNPCNFLKHSCQPNTVLTGKNEVLALSEIQQGEELTIDDSITELDPRWKRKCNCGEKNCRKVIRSIQFLPEEIFKKYEPYVSDFASKTYKGTKAVSR